MPRLTAPPHPPERPATLAAFQRRLLAWYRRHQRPLPWRQTRDPYKILVSEVMLQQTQVDRVIPKYHQFLERYPDLPTLAKSRLPELKKVWYPLGYNIRPLRLRQIAKTVVKHHAGLLPDSYDGLIALDGIGRYTAGAVLSFAFGKDAAILDTNVARLLGRYFGVIGPAAVAPADPTGTVTAAPKTGPKGRPKGATERRLWELAALVIPPGNAYDINQAMMDFGAMICTARKPACAGCALRKDCATYPYEKASEQTSPVKPAPAKRQRRDRAA